MSNEEDLLLNMHDLGYNLFNFNALTYPELNGLFRAAERRNKRMKQKSKK